MTEDGDQDLDEASRRSVGELLERLVAMSRKADDPTLDGALSAARVAMDEWRAQCELLAFHERARQQAASSEASARHRISAVMDLVTQLANRPHFPSPGGFPEATAEGYAARGMRASDCEAADPDDDRQREEHDEAPSPRTARTVAGSTADGGLRIRLLGRFEVRANGRPVVDWKGRRGAAVLQVLVGRRGEPVDREVLIEALWPEMRPEEGRRRLHQAVYNLRQSLHIVDPDHEYILSDNGRYRLNTSLLVWTDVAEFDRLVEEGERHVAAGRERDAENAWRTAVQLYGGDLLEDCQLPEWAETEQRRLRERYILVGNRLARLCSEQQQHAEALSFCRRVLQRDSWNEEATMIAMESHVATGGRSLAVRLFRSFEHELRRELGITPSAKVRELYSRIVAAGDPEPSACGEPAGTPHGLP